MVISGVVSLAASGALLAIVVRWLLQLDVAIGWTACVGAVSLAMQPWLNDYLGLASSAYSVPQMVMASVLIVAVLGITEIIRGS